ncbi:hypothetical protein HED60_04880 [Planctomycetales bacterium ZRK34]|nr:hypothetical protein HED60_04880 [Planctomycetales bacterium ZRK34]
MSEFGKLILTICLALGAAACTKSTPPESKTDTSESPARVRVLTDLDADGNGLYDDAERKALLDELTKQCPELTGAFDADGDGRVTIAEQTRDRHPVSVLVNREHIAASHDKIPWAIDIFPEWLSSAYLQEDLGPGPIAELQPRGTIHITAAQETESLQPGMSAPGAGIEFAADSGQHLVMPGHRDARWNYRWCLFTFRIDANTGADDQTVLLDLNHGKDSNKSSPKVWYNKKTGLSVQYVGYNAWGIDQRLMTTDRVVADGKTWNVLVCGIRYGQMFASVNGVALAAESKQPPRFSGDWPHDTTTYLGDKSNANMAWACDALVFGLTEPSEAMVRKMTGWAAHRRGFAANLPADHPYHAARPVLDDEDFPYRYVHDNDKWTAWGESLKKSVTRVNAGGPRVEPMGFERVFYDDFRADRVKASTSGEGDLWLGPGYNIAVGGAAPLVTPGHKPDTYPYDAENQKQILSLVQQGKRWRGSAFYSVNDLGHGHTWIGPKIFRIRCMFPKIDPKQLPRGLFPAFWSYSPEALFWRTANRIECDWFEFDSANGRWLNGMSTHYHYAYLKNNIFAKNPKSYQRYKAYSGELTPGKSKLPRELFIWDGQYHTWEYVVDQDTTYVNVTMPDGEGGEQWFEIYRCPTAPTYLERLDLQLDYALKSNHKGLPEGQRQDFVVDWVEVLQKTHDLEALPAPYTQRPTLSGSNTAGSTITCDAHLDDITDVRYFWFADGYPLTWGPSNTYTLTEADAEKAIRCKVKAVGARNMPEAWTATLN